MPIHPATQVQKRTELSYLGYYLTRHRLGCYYYAVEHCGFQTSPGRTPATDSKYNLIDDKINNLHYSTTHVKFGISRTLHNARQGIRSSKITR